MEFYAQFEASLMHFYKASSLLTIALLQHVLSCVHAFLLQSCLTGLLVMLIMHRIMHGQAPALEVKAAMTTEPAADGRFSGRGQRMDKNGKARSGAFAASFSCCAFTLLLPSLPVLLHAACATVSTCQPGCRAGVILHPAFVMAMLCACRI